MKPSVGRRFLNTYFAASLDLRVQAFNLLAFAGMAAGVITALSALFTGAGLANVTLNLSGTAVGFLCLRYARRTNRYRAGFLVSVVAVFVILFPLLFFSAGGYRSGMPCFFIFALIFTAIMLEGKTRTAFIILEFALYAACFFIAFYFPGAVRHFETRFDYMFDALTGVVVVGAILVIIVLLYMRIYDSRQKRLHELNKLKTEFLQDIGHEVRNPLQVIAYGVDFMRSSMGTEGGTEEMHNALNIIQDKAVRLGLMINGMVDLATMSGDPASRAKADFAAMLRQSVEDVRPEAERKHNALRVEIAPDLPQVYAVPEQLARVPVNL
ncbi:MAG: HAMP domain-containing histidine kinase, partial [Gracilibacteraceae bacterium]|nr:HAMP domain-containing histidine kinase [Gracilibacteraceae bacterium]